MRFLPENREPEMIEKYLDDLENRIDPQAEDALVEQWKNFLQGKCPTPVFSPSRPAKRPPLIEWPHILVNDALDDFELMALQQFGACSSALENAAGQILCVRCNYGTAIIPSLFGAKLFIMDIRDFASCFK